MSTTRNLLAISAVSILMTFSGCATTEGSLTRSADRLERNADLLARSSRDDSSSGYYSRHASELADEAHEFRQTVNDRQADDRDVKNAFEELSRDYHALRDEIDRSEGREAQLDFRAITEAYLDVERALNQRTDPHARRYAGEREPNDRY